MDDFIFCKNLILSFVSEYLNGNIYSFMDFDFATLIYDKRFGCRGRAFDCDDTNLMRAIYFLLWSDTFPDLELSQIGTGKKYRGDTLNTVRTIFGRYSPELRSFIGLQKSGADQAIQNLTNQFLATYHTIGNFILLPNIAESDQKRAYTLNTYRGTAYKDYFDLFLLQLSFCLKKDKNTDKHLLNLIDRNNFFFSWLNKKGGLNYFREICWLDDYFLNSEPNKIFAPHVFYLRKKGVWTDFEKSFYIENINKYIIKATKIIKNRAIKMLDKLSALCFSDLQ